MLKAGLYTISLILGVTASTDAEALSTILVVHPDSESAQQVLSGMTDEIGEDLNIVTVQFTSAMTMTMLETLLSEHKPEALVLMNNPTVELYKAYQATKPPGTVFPPAVMLLTSYLEQTANGIKNVTGIHYEVAAVSSMVNLRSIVESKVERVGVIYRDVFENFVEEQRTLARQEKIQLVGRRIRSDAVERDLKPLLRQLLVADIDVLWVLNDNQLLSPLSVASTWLPALKHNRFPVVVGVQSLVSADFRFGTFALLPDHQALGVQAAEILFELEESEWQASDIRFQKPVTVKKVLNVPLAQRLAGIKEGALDSVDVLVK